MASILGHRNLALASIAFFFGPVCEAAAQDYHPLTVGSQWEYFSTVDGTDMMSITGEEEVLGTLTRVRREIAEAETIDTFLTQDAAGNLFCHGSRNLTLHLEFAFVPPLRMVDAPLSLGKTWTITQVMRYHFDGTPFTEEPFDLVFRVYTEGNVSVPAGDFFAYGVGYSLGFPGRFRASAGDLDILGHHPRDQNRQSYPMEWYAVGVGLVIHTYLEDEQLGYRLVSYSIVPTATHNETWSGIKVLFR